MSGFFAAGSGLSGLSGVSLNGRAVTVSETTFTLASASNDGSIQAADSVYPPAAAPTHYDSLGFVQRSKSGANYFVAVACFGWDTSSLNDSATVTDAKLKLSLTTLADNDNMSLVAEWYDYGASIGTNDYTATPASTAGSWDIGSLTASAVNTLTLSNPTNVSKTGTTKLRLHLSAGTPTALNQVNFTVYEDGGNRPQLVVTTEL